MNKNISCPLTLAFVFLQIFGAVSSLATPKSHAIEKLQRPAHNVRQAAESSPSGGLIFDTSVVSSTPISQSPTTTGSLIVEPSAASPALQPSPAISPEADAGDSSATGLIFDTAVDSPANPSESLAVDSGIATPTGELTTSLAIPLSGSPAVATNAVPSTSSNAPGAPRVSGGQGDVTVSLSGTSGITAPSPTSGNGAPSLTVSIGHVIGLGLAFGAIVLA